MSFNHPNTVGYQKKGTPVGNHTKMALEHAQRMGYDAVVSPVEHDESGDASFTVTHKDGTRSSHSYAPGSR